MNYLNMLDLKLGRTINPIEFENVLTNFTKYIAKEYPNDTDNKNLLRKIIAVDQLFEGALPRYDLGDTYSTIYIDRNKEVKLYKGEINEFLCPVFQLVNYHGNSDFIDPLKDLLRQEDELFIRLLKELLLYWPIKQFSWDLEEEWCKEMMFEDIATILIPDRDDIEEFIEKKFPTKQIIRNPAIDNYIFSFAEKNLVGVIPQRVSHCYMIDVIWEELGMFITLQKGSVVIHSIKDIIENMDPISVMKRVEL